MAKKKKARRKSGANKSQAIRDYLKKKPGAKPKEIKEALAKQGIVVTDSLVSQVKYNSGANKKAAKRGRPKGGKRRKVSAAGRRRRQTTTSNGLTYDALFEAKTLADRMGGIEKAKQALAMLEQLT